jgi:predicted metal-dependent hydrolase
MCRWFRDTSTRRDCKHSFGSSTDDQFQDAERQTVREMVTGESHYVWGRRRRLSVIQRPGRAHVELDHRRLLLYIPPGTDTATRVQVLQRWQREELRRAVPPLIARWEKEIGRQVTFWGIRRMKTMWGSCNRETARIWLNLELIKKDPVCLEYVVVHEMAHLLERNHGERFVGLMDSLIPDWRARRDALNRAPLADETWILAAKPPTQHVISLTTQTSNRRHAAAARISPNSCAHCTRCLVLLPLPACGGGGSAPSQTFLTSSPSASASEDEVRNNDYTPHL